jgi:O-antigen/teichoic acid export membrane protein
VSATLGSRPGLVGALAAHLRDPMRRSAYALVVGTAITSGLGLVFWVLAARWLPAATVGLGAAVVSAMVLLANVSTLGLRNSLVRFLPTAGAGARRLVISAYGLCAGAAIAAAAVFLLGQPLWAAKLGFLRDGPLAAAAFVLGVALWVVFVLQDHVLIGLRRAVWVPATNGICSLAKIILLPLVAVTAAWAIFVATVVPAAVAVVVVTAAVLRSSTRTGPEVEPQRVPVSRLVRFAATDHASQLLWMATSDLLTLLVLQRAGAEASAYYFMANTIGYTLYLVISNVGSALVAEGARHPERSAELARQALRHAARLVLPLALVGVLAAPWVLRLLGPAYAANATVLLQLLLASAAPQIVIGIALGAARIRHDLPTILIIYAALAVGAFGGSALLLDRWGLPGVGWACLGTQTAVALLLLLSGRSGLGADGPGRPTVLAGAEALPAVIRRRRGARQARRLLRPALRACGLDPETTPTRLLPADCDTVVVAVGTVEPAVLKIATTAASAAGLDRHTELLCWLRQQLVTGPVAELLPQVLRRTTVAGAPVLLESRLPGVRADGGDPRVTAAALAGIAELHRSTATPVTVDTDLLAAWVDEPLRQLECHPALAAGRVLSQLGADLRAALAGRAVTAGCVHGDFWPGNVLVGRGGPEQAGRRLSGIIDWENARRIGLPDTDLVHWWLSAQPGELGAAVRQALLAPELTAARLVESGADLPNPQLDLSAVVVLTWLGHVAAGLTRASANRLGRVWLARNVKPVLRLAAGPAWPLRPAERCR